MCLALPARVVERLADDQAIVDLGGVRKSISLALVPEAQVGDYVIVHVGHAIGMVDEEEAQRTLALFAELATFEAQQQATLAYQDQEQWARMSILNTASSGKFSTDRTMREYNAEIWKLQPLPEMPLN